MTVKITQDQLDQKRQSFLERKKTLRKYLEELIRILDQSGQKPLSGKNRKTFMDKFSMIDHRLLDRFDVSSYEYFEAWEQNNSS